MNAPDIAGFVERYADHPPLASGTERHTIGNAGGNTFTARQIVQRDCQAEFQGARKAHAGMTGDDCLDRPVSLRIASLPAKRETRHECGCGPCCTARKGGELMKRVVWFIGISALCAATASATQFGVRAGYYGNDIKKGFVGAELVFPFGSLAINPSIDYTKSAGVGLWFGSADVQYMFHPGGGPTYWVGAGPTYFLETYSGSGASNEHEECS